LTSNEVLKRLFRLAQRLAKGEAAHSYSRISEIRGPFSWSFLEHLSELPEAGQSELLCALVKRRFAMEGLRLPETTLSIQEELEVQHWLKHNNSIHGTRVEASLVGNTLSVREEEFEKTKASLTAPTRDDIREALRNELKSLSISVQIVRDLRRELWWSAQQGNLIISECIELGAKTGAFGEGLIHIRDGDHPLCVPISFLRILGVGATSWDFLQKGEEHVYAASTIWFFGEVCHAMFR